MSEVKRGPYEGAIAQPTLVEGYGNLNDVQPYCEPCDLPAGWVWSMYGPEPCCPECGRYSDKYREWLRGWYEWEPE